MIHSFVTKSEIDHGDLPWCHLEWLSSPTLTGAQRLLLIRVEFQEGDQHNFHYHPGREEIIYVLEGECEQWVGAQTKLLGVGEVAHIPADLPHALKNTGSGPLKILAILSPTESDGEFTVDVSDQEPWKTLMPAKAYPDGSAIQIRTNPH